MLLTQASREEKPVRTLDLSEAEHAAIKELGLLSAKPILYVANVDESDLEGGRRTGTESS